MNQVEKNYYWAIFFVLCFMSFSTQAQGKANNWQQFVQEQIKLFGHRNWILVVDAAYPLQSNSGIKTINSDTEQLRVVDYILEVIKKEKHVIPEVFLDKEIDFVPEKREGEVQQYRDELNKLLKGTEITKVLHEDLIAMVDESASIFNVLVIKTNLTIPYTSVFIRLNCGYWDVNSEQEMRKKMQMNK